MEIILPITTPIVDCYPDLANMLSILNCDKLADEWIATNFIQLVYRRNKDTSYGSFLDFMRMGNDISVYEHCPYLYVNHIDKDFVNDLFGSVFQFVEYCLKKNIYLQMYTNKKYLPQKRSIKYDFLHETFIYGIDTEREKIYLSDFYDEKYSNVQFKFCDFEQAYLNSFSNNPYFKSDIYLKTNLAKYNMNKIILLKYNPHDMYTMDKNIICMKVRDYIEGRDSFKRITESYIASGYDFYYGVDFYDQLILDMDLNSFDMRKPHVLLSHKILLKRQISTLFKKGFISRESYDLIVPEVEFLIKMGSQLQNKYLMMKMRPEKRKTELDNLKNGYTRMKALDIELMGQMLKSMSL